MTRSDDFDLAALHQALDAQRRARGLSWTEVMREINRGATRAVASSTVSRLGTRPVAEADGVLQMLVWLGRTPESFAADPRGDDAGATLPDAGPGRMLRFDTRDLHAVLDARRIERRLTWTQLARDLGVGTSSLTGLARGGRTSFPQVMRMVRWLGASAARFVRSSDR
jgi:ribosomal protein L24E